MSQIHKPGKTCEISGIYNIVKDSGKTPTGHQRTVSRGDQFPPTPRAGQGYVIAKRTKT